MSRSILNGTAKVLVLEESGAARQSWCDIVRECGFHDTTAAASVKDALAILARERIDWIISSLQIEQPVSALRLAKHLCEEPELRRVRLSLLYAPSEAPLLPAAFALGTMSCHPKDQGRDESLAEIRRLLAQHKAANGRGALVAAEYLRPLLIKAQSLVALKELEQSLLRLAPGSSALVFRLGEAQILAGETALGTQTLRQAAILDERLTQPGRDLLDRLPSPRPAPSARGSRPSNVLGLDRVVVIDPDTAVLTSIQALLTSVGVSRIETYDDGALAWEALAGAEKPDLIIQEWRLPTLGAPSLLQRMRLDGFGDVPIVVLSSTIKPADIHLLREMDVDNIIPKPFGQQLFFKNLVWTIQQAQRPTEQKTLERRIRRLLLAGDVDEIERLRELYAEDDRIAIGPRKHLEAAIAYQRGLYREARDQAIEALKLSGDSLLLVSLVGKALLKLGDHGAAAKFFEKANSLSPTNIEHLCDLAATEFEADRPEQALAYLERARAIDAQSKRPAELECRYALARGQVERAKELLGQGAARARVVRLVIESADEWTRSGRYERGIRLCEQTLSALPRECTDEHEALVYQLALAYARFGDVETARVHLRALVARPESVLYAKAATLLARLEGTGATLLKMVPGGDAPPAAGEEASGSRRECCLHGAFREGLTALTVVEHLARPLPTPDPYAASTRDWAGAVGMKKDRR